MNDTQTCINIFNSIIRGDPVDFQKTLLPFISEYLSETGCKQLNETISVLVQHPELIQKLFPKIVDFYTRKHEICTVIQNNKTILYFI